MSITPPDPPEIDPPDLTDLDVNAWRRAFGRQPNDRLAWARALTVPRLKLSHNHHTEPSLEDNHAAALRAETALELARLMAALTIERRESEPAGVSIVHWIGAGALTVVLAILVAVALVALAGSPLAEAAPLSGLLLASWVVLWGFFRGRGR